MAAGPPAYARAIVTGGRCRIDVAGELFGATAQLRAAYDPDGKRVKA